MEEIWKDIPNYENLYQISNYGRVKTIKNGKTRYLKPEVLKKGYLRVSIWKNKVRKRILVHRLVAQAFIPNNDKMKNQIDHINNDTSDNRAENLRWVTPKENVQHSIQQGRFITEKKKNTYKKIWDSKSEEEKEKTIKRLREASKGRTPWNKGKKGLTKHSDEWKKEASIRMKERMKEKQTPIVCIETGEKFKSQIEASKIKKISLGNLNSCLKGKRRIAGGYHWCYLRKER